MNSRNLAQRTPRGILTIEDDMTVDRVSDLVSRFRKALRGSPLIVTGPEMKFTPLPPLKPRIRLAWSEKGHR